VFGGVVESAFQVVSGVRLVSVFFVQSVEFGLEFEDAVVQALVFFHQFGHSGLVGVPAFFVGVEEFG